MKITVSLLNAYRFAVSCPPSWKDRALESLKNTLTQGFTGSPATERGEKYETQVNRLLYERHTFTGIEKPLNALSSFVQQQWIKPLTIQGIIRGEDMSFTFKGKMDYYGAPEKKYCKLLNVPKTENMIIDLKTTGSAIKTDRYEEGVQHHVYCAAMGVEHFSYIVCRFDKDEDLAPAEIEVVNIDLTDSLKKSVSLLQSNIEGMVCFLKDYNLWREYFEIFNGGNK